MQTGIYSRVVGGMCTTINKNRVNSQRLCVRGIERVLAVGNLRFFKDACQSERYSRKGVEMRGRCLGSGKSEFSHFRERPWRWRVLMIRATNMTFTAFILNYLYLDLFFI